MTVTGVLIIANGVFALVFVGCADAEMRSRAREHAALAAAGTAVLPRHHAMPLRTDMAITFRAVALAVLVELAALIDNLTAPMRGIA